MEIPRANLIPMVIEHTATGERAYDIYSRLLKDRIIFISGGITSETSSAVIAQMLFLQLDNKTSDISMYIMSPGGSVQAALAIYDTMQHINNDIATYCIGEACSAAAFLLACGAKGKRFALPTSRIMIHQPWGGTHGTVTDIAIQAKEMERIKQQLYERLAAHTGKTIAEISSDSERDNFMSAKNAMEYGIVDSVLEPKKKRK